MQQGHTESYFELVRFYSRFHQYSIANSILIMMQKPDADAVAGYRRWQELGRQVRKNAKAAHIWCPVIRKVENESSSDEDLVVLSFKTGYVFSDKDLVDADTNPLPTARPPLADTYPELLSRLVTAVEDSGVAIRFVPHIRGAEGYYSRSSHQIVLEEGKDSHNQVLILLHEWGHALFHAHQDAADWPKEQKEFEAETVAMVMGHLLGLDAPAAPDYLLCYGATPQQLKASFGHIQATGQNDDHSPGDRSSHFLIILMPSRHFLKSTGVASLGSGGRVLHTKRR